MNHAFQDAILLVCASGALLLGRFMVRHPERVYRFFTFGLRPDRKSGVMFFKAVGWLYVVGSALGILMYIDLIVHDLLP